MGLCETRLGKKIEDHELSVQGYKIFRNDQDSKGRGVAIYVKDSLPVPTIKIRSVKLELPSLEIKPTNARSFFLVCWYRPPTSSVDETAFENLRETLGMLDKEGKEIISVGETNCDFKDKKNANANKLKFVYSEYQMEQLMETYTRVAVTAAPNGEKRISISLIDHLSTSNPKYILKTGILDTGMFDHYLVYGIRKVNAWRYKRENKNPTTIEFRNMLCFYRIYNK